MQFLPPLIGIVTFLSACSAQYGNRLDTKRVLRPLAHLTLQGLLCCAEMAGFISGESNSKYPQMGHDVMLITCTRAHVHTVGLGISSNDSTRRALCFFSAHPLGA